MYRASQVIKSMINSRGKSISVAYVTKTDAWERLAPAQSVQNQFVAVAEKYKDAVKDDTVKVAMKEADHPSQNDASNHYSVFELDKNDNVIASNMFVGAVSALQRARNIIGHYTRS